MAASTVYSVTFEPKISRWFVFRSLWMVVEIWVMIGWSLWIAIIGFLHFWYMLILGRRNRGFWDMEMHFFRHSIKWQAYLQKLSNGRPKFIED
jgi:hypothetical protein